MSSSSSTMRMRSSAISVVILVSAGRSGNSASYYQHRVGRATREPGPPRERCELDAKYQGHPPRAQPLDELGSGGGCPSRRQNVVHDEHTFSRRERVGVDLE